MAWYAMRSFRHDGVRFQPGRQVVGQPLARLEDWERIGLVERRADLPTPPGIPAGDGKAKARKRS